MVRSRLAALVLIAGCGPSTGPDEECTPEDVVTSGALVTGVEPRECSPCALDGSYVLITLETTCEAGVEWPGTPRLIGPTTAVDLATNERFTFENPFGAPAEQLWRVAPDEPVEWPGPSVDEIVTKPGDYSFRVELLYELMTVEFEGSIE
ncbi:MAG: hypothetical protein KDK70_20645 [Myxococcales bacterium]|nr:hypothetical protein [Myxococcales bacterium]